MLRSHVCHSECIDCLTRCSQPHSATAGFNKAVGAGTGSHSGFDSSLAPGVGGQGMGQGVTPASLAGTVPVGAVGGTTPAVGGSAAPMAGHTSAMGSSGVTLHSSQVCALLWLACAAAV